MSRNKLLTSLRTAFFAGVALLLPLAVTATVFVWLIERVGRGFRPIFFFYVPDSLRDNPVLGLLWDVLATVIVIALITAMGYLSRYILGHYAARRAEELIQSIPGVGLIYGSVKQVVDTLVTQKRSLVEAVVLVQFPREGTYSIGFLTNRAQGEVQSRMGKDLWTILVPTTPNPSSGFLVLVPQDQVTILDVSLGDAMKLVISGGTVSPPAKPSPERAP